MINRETIASIWAENIVPVHPVPTNLFPHQLDTMALLRDGRNVFLGKITALGYFI